LQQVVQERQIGGTSETGVAMLTAAKRKLLLSVVVAVITLAACPGVPAQTYPSHPITMIVPFPAGGATDTLGRFLAERLHGSLGQPVVIENVAGAAGTTVSAAPYVRPLTAIR
jgi:tripartite-type tricarboxylate transporter receptor subunit TctC